MSAPVLFAWELGDGLGHVSRLLRIAERLRRLGFESVFAVRNMEPAGIVVDAAGFPVLQAPVARVAPIRGPDGTQPVSTGDILGAIGFDSVDRLRTLVSAWARLIGMVRPAVVVTDYAPTANLALHGGTIPWIPIGDGFTLPAFETERFPPFRKGRPAHDEDALLEVAAAVQSARGRPAPERLPRLFEGKARFVIALPELDPWHRLRSVPAIGPIPAPPAPAEREPVEDYFAYLSDSFRFTERVLEGLAASGCTGSVYLRDASRERRDEWRRRGLVMWDGPQDVVRMAGRAAVIVHHGGVGMAEQVLGLGRPQLLVPRHFEQFRNADAIGRLGCGVSLRGDGRFRLEDVAAALAAAAGLAGRRERASEVARRLKHRHWGALEAVVACIGAMAAGEAPPPAPGDCGGIVTGN